MRHHSIICAMALLLSVTIGQAETAAMVVPVQRLTLETTTRMAQAAIAECRKQGLQVSVALVDRDGTLQLQMRDTLAAAVSLQISRAKAYTAANFGVATSRLGDRANSPIGRQPGLVMSAGGLPIEAAGSLLGAIGVSGAPAGTTDEACAQAGIDAVLDDLELSL